jgi:hypothetical protein
MPVIKTNPDNFLINLPPVKKGFGRKTTIAKRTGKTKSKFTIEVKAEPIAVAATAYGLADPLAEAFLWGVSSRIKQVGVRYKVSPDSIARRRSWGSSADTPSAQFRFKAPMKNLSRKQKKENMFLPPKDRHRPTMKKNARPDDPPDPSATGWLNHSGRLREGLTLFRGKGAARYSKSKDQFVWTIAATANRLKDDTFGGTTNDFEWFQTEFNDLVKPQLATQSTKYRTALFGVQRDSVIKLTEDLRVKRKMLRDMQLKMIGSVIKVILG